MEEINIAFICDKGYVLGTRTAINSIIKSASSDSIINIHVLSIGLEIEQEESLQKSNSDKVNIKVYKVSEVPDIGWSHSRVTKAALIKFSLARILSEIEKVLYLDGDVIVRRDLTELYTTDLEDNYVGAVVDIPSIYELGWHKELGIETYFSSGVMLLNLEKIRDDNIEEKLVNAKKADTRCHFMDQDAFNLVFYEKVKFLSIKYNLIWSCLSKYPIEDVARLSGLTVKEVSEIYKSPTIIHFADSKKPWNSLDVQRSGIWYENLEIANLPMCLSAITQKKEYEFESRFKAIEDEYKLRLEKVEKEVSVLHDCVNDIQNSYSFKVGMILTYLPRQIQKIVKKIGK